MTEEREYIPKCDMEIGRAYLCDARSLISHNGVSHAIWDGESFQGMREKWGSVFMSPEFHWDDGAPYGTVKPLWKL